MPRRTKHATGSRAEKPAPFTIGDQSIAPGSRLRFDLPAFLLPTHTQLHIPLTVVHGRRPGPVLWVSAVVHGDELNGLEIIRRVLENLEDPMTKGTLIAAPIVNVFGFIGQSRYMPDRRDLNRSFPGSKTGSLAARLAALFMREVVARSTHGIDLHTASTDKANLAQIRGDLTHPEARRLASAFGAPVMVQATTRSGSLRGSATKRGIPTVVYEAGEPQRFNEPEIQIGVRGIFGVLRELGMCSIRMGKRQKSVLVEESSWVRAKRGGLLRLRANVGGTVEAGDAMGTVADPFGSDSVQVRAPFRGIVIGQTNNPVVHAGDAVVHLGRLDAAP